MSEPPNQNPNFSKGPDDDPSQQPGAGGADPYGQTQYGQPQYGQPPAGGQYQPPQTPPPYGTPTGGEQPPSYGTPPTYGTPGDQQPPSYGTPPPGTTPPGATPPPYGSTAGYGSNPGYGSTPGYGATPGYGVPAAGAPYGGAPGAPQNVNIGEALSWAWAQFKANPGPMIVPGLLVLVVAAVATALYFVVAALSSTTTTQTADYGNGYSYSYEVSSFSVGGFIIGILIYIVMAIVLIYLQVSMTTGALRVANGEPVTVATFLKPQRIGQVFLAGLLVGLIVGIGLILCIIPGLVALFFLQFAVFFVIDKSSSPTAALGESANLAKTSVSNSLLTLVVANALSYVGTLLCYVGLIVTWPIGQLFYAHCYRRMSGGYVAPAPQ
ncbi:hypothetical protein [Gordonia sp. NB41Y]|uniref:hypothetical protein n=1 Tax=Gordonia sp. NB41Y TaxID=875808 RepID=UPI0006B2212D|nr:hypothetical protein [Gordonia sp. NB41Y]EMP12668.2 membrane protein [Gordonia sp. NB41Y]WLP89259.1 hypothetical protein Q9K23_16895 [Gordonia sp. NB41Y]